MKGKRFCKSPPELTITVYSPAYYHYCHQTLLIRSSHGNTIKYKKFFFALPFFWKTLTASLGPLPITRCCTLSTTTTYTIFHASSPDKILRALSITLVPNLSHSLSLINIFHTHIQFSWNSALLEQLVIYQSGQLLKMGWLVNFI